MESVRKDSPSVDGELSHLDLLRKAATYRDIGYSPEEAIKALKVISLEDQACVRSVFIGSTQATKFPDLKKGKNGQWSVVKDSPENMEYLITEELKLDPALNQLKNRIYTNERPIDDFDLSKISNSAKRNSLNFTKDHITAVLNEIGQKNSYHPFKQFVESSSWDGVDRIQLLFETLTINPEFSDHKLLYFEYLKRWLIGIVAKVYFPGSQNGVLTFQGDQGKGKSQWLMKLGKVKECYGEGGINPDSKDDQLKHLDYILWHASELDGIVRKQDVAALKDYLTKSDVAVRPPYGRFDRIGKSVCSFCASVNSSQFLNDTSGSRRFFVIPIIEIDYKHAIDIQQIFAQAHALFLGGKKWWFDSEEILMIDIANESFNLETPVNDMASRIQAGSDQMTGSELFESFGWDRPHHGDLTKLGSLLKKKGIKSERVKRNETLVTVYFVKKIQRTV